MSILNIVRMSSDNFAFNSILRPTHTREEVMMDRHDLL